MLPVSMGKRRLEPVLRAFWFVCKAFMWKGKLLAASRELPLGYGCSAELVLLKVTFQPVPPSCEMQKLNPRGSLFRS